MERDTTQRLTVTRSRATVTYEVDYGETPPIIRLYARASDNSWTLDVEELMPRRFGTSIRWKMHAHSGRVASGRAEWRKTVALRMSAGLDVCCDEGADLLVALASARLAAAKRWRVVRRRMAQAEVDAMEMRAMIEDER